MTGSSGLSARAEALQAYSVRLVAADLALRGAWTGPQAAALAAQVTEPMVVASRELERELHRASAVAVSVLTELERLASGW